MLSPRHYIDSTQSFDFMVRGARGSRHVRVTFAVDRLALCAFITKSHGAPHAHSLTEARPQAARPLGSPPHGGADGPVRPHRTPPARVGSGRHLRLVRPPVPPFRARPRSRGRQHRGRRPDRPEQPHRCHQPAVPLHRRRGRLLPHPGAALRSGPRHLGVERRERRDHRPVHRPRRHQPAVPGQSERRLLQLREPLLGQGPRRVGVVDLRGLAALAVRRDRRDEPAVPAHRGRRRAAERVPG